MKFYIILMVLMAVVNAAFAGYRYQTDGPWKMRTALVVFLLGAAFLQLVLL